MDTNSPTRMENTYHLLERVSAAARRAPGAVECYLFGSLAAPETRDAYADIDLRVVSHDLALSRPAWPWVLAQAGALELVYALQDDAHAAAYTIAFAGESPYHKVDIGLCRQADPQSFIHKLEKKVLLWSQPAADAAPVAAPGDVLAPTPGSAQYFLVGEVLSAVRYAKARKRGQHLACWRFISAKFNALLRCYHWNGDPERFPEQALSTWDYTALDHRLPEPERLALLDGLSLRTPAEMDRALVRITRQMVERIMTGDAWVERYMDFLEGELAGA